MSRPGPDSPEFSNEPEVTKTAKSFIGYLTHPGEIIGYLTPKGKQYYNNNENEIIEEYNRLVGEYKRLEGKKEKSKFINDIKTQLQGTDLFIENIHFNTAHTLKGGRPTSIDGPSINDLWERAPGLTQLEEIILIIAGGLFVLGVANAVLGGSKHKKRKDRKSKKTKKSMKHKKGRKSKKAKKSMKKRKSMKKKKSMKKRK